MIDGRKQAVSGWALNIMGDNPRNERNTIKAEINAQYDKRHGAATIKSGDKSIIPSEELAKGNGEYRPIVAVRIFHGGPQQVVNNLAYFYHTGYMHCNLMQDVHLEEGVYGYIDIEGAINKL